MPVKLPRRPADAPSKEDTNTSIATKIVVVVTGALTHSRARGLDIMDDDDDNDNDVEAVLLVCMFFPTYMCLFGFFETQSSLTNCERGTRE